MGVSIKDLDNDNASFEEGTLTDVVAVNDSLELANNPTLSFDGVDDYVDIIGYKGFAGSFAIETMIYPRNAEQTGIRPFFNNYYSGNPEFHIQVKSNNINCFVRTNTDSLGLSGNITINNNTWYKVKMVYDEPNNQLEIYVDDTLDTTGTINGSYDPADTRDLRIGARAHDSSYAFDGKISYLKFSDLMNTINFWKIEEGSGTTLTDSAGTNDGTIYGASWQDNYISWNLDGTGTRQSPQLDLSAVNDVASSSISWTETLNSQTITIETSVDGGSTWQIATNGGSIPNLPANPTTLDVRQVLETNDTTVTPVLESLTVDIDTAEENTDSGSFTATLEQEDFKVKPQNDSGSLTGTEEDNGIKVKPQNDSGSFNIDAENWYTMVLEVFQEGLLASNSNYKDYKDNWKLTEDAKGTWTKIEGAKSTNWTKVKDAESVEWKEV